MSYCQQCAKLERENTELRSALQGMFAAADEMAAEFNLHKRAANWGIINDAYCVASKLLVVDKRGNEKIKPIFKKVTERKLEGASVVRDILECGHYIVVRNGDNEKSKRKCETCMAEALAAKKRNKE